MNSQKIVKIAIAVLSALLILSICALAFVLIRGQIDLQSTRETVDDNYIKPEAEAELSYTFLGISEKEDLGYAR